MVKEAFDKSRAAANHSSGNKPRLAGSIRSRACKGRLAMGRQPEVPAPNASPKKLTTTHPWGQSRPFQPEKDCRPFQGPFHSPGPDCNTRVGVTQPVFARAIKNKKRRKKGQGVSGCAAPPCRLLTAAPL